MYALIWMYFVCPTVGVLCRPLCGCILYALPWVSDVGPTVGVFCMPYRGYAGVETLRPVMQSANLVLEIIQ